LIRETNSSNLKIWICCYEVFPCSDIGSSDFVSMCKAVHGKLTEQIKDVETAQSKEVPLFWCGMAEVIILFIYLGFFFAHENRVSFILGHLVLLIYDDMEHFNLGQRLSYNLKRF
jgi:hypothetical protein